MKKKHLAAKVVTEEARGHAAGSLSNHDHIHAVNCGHASFVHGNHIDFLHDDHYHYVENGYTFECPGPNTPVKTPTKGAAVLAFDPSKRKPHK